MKTSVYKKRFFLPKTNLRVRTDGIDDDQLIDNFLYSGHKIKHRKSTKHLVFKKIKFGNQIFSIKTLSNQIERHLLKNKNGNMSPAGGRVVSKTCPLHHTYRVGVGGEIKISKSYQKSNRKQQVLFRVATSIANIVANIVANPPRRHSPSWRTTL